MLSNLALAPLRHNAAPPSSSRFCRLTADALNQLCCVRFATHSTAVSCMGLFNKNSGLALLAGLSCVFGFAPFGIYAIPVLALAALFVLWSRADNRPAAAWLGFSFGLGVFVAGIGWVYVALHDYGGMPLLLALPATLLFAAFIALFPALAGYAQARFGKTHGVRFPAANGMRTVLAMPAAWVLAEWLRGTIFTGFPWLALGYAHSDSPLADRKSTRLNSSHQKISYAVFCLKKKKTRSDNRRQERPNAKRGGGKSEGGK